ncbi:MAG: 3-demethylubiquinone-9 3-methyltransferase [Caulobacter sp.]|nr:3-demethylubiquinone-9 3-methyltransferase [Caulobacter sp.]
MTNILPFLMFEGRAEEAMRFYAGLFPDASIDEVNPWPPGSPGKPGTIMTARFTLAGQSFMVTDSSVNHAFTFTPSVSFFVNVDDLAQLEHLAAELGQGGQVLMGIGSYGFSQRFTWLNDRFGVSWQINLP